MHPFTFTKVTEAEAAITASRNTANSKYIGGGTNIIDLMRLNIEKPAHLIDISGLELKKIEVLENGNVRIGALVRNSDLAYDATISTRYPLLSKALLSGASPQVRNMATTGGNLLQRTKCWYFHDSDMPCNKREPGSGCSAIIGYNRDHAILGTSEKCIATHPSDMCVALAALDAVIHVQGETGVRTIPFSEFHTLPGDTPEKENTLLKDELVIYIELPDLPFVVNSTYLKTGDRSPYDFAIASAAVALDVNDGIIKAARLALGGVGTKPWHAVNAEQWLTGKPNITAVYKEAADIALANASAFKYNTFKIALAKQIIIRALQHLGS